ncbi:MAG: hypothetical protein ACTTJZ_00770 [Sphaerochaetaceae bacterium]
MEIVLQRKCTFIPSVLGNEKMPEGTRIEIDYDKPKSYQRRAWQKVTVKRHPDGSFSSFEDRDLKAIMTESNIAVRNLFYETTGENGMRTKVYVTTGEQLVNLQSDIAYLIVEQLATQILTPDLTQEALKNSPEALPQSSEDTPKPKSSRKRTASSTASSPSS